MRGWADPLPWDMGQQLETFLGVMTWEESFHRHLAGGGQGAAKHTSVHRMGPTTKNNQDQNVSNVEIKRLGTNLTPFLNSFLFVEQREDQR